MHCKNCDYALWNLKGRQCPECGVAFTPSDFEFVINSVRFCCPHCDQAYYGTGAKGHLVPREFNCVACGRRISMDDTVLRPAEGLLEQQTQVAPMPWLERRKGGVLRGWFRTVGMALVSPQRLIRATPPGSSIGQALWFAIISTFVTALICMVPLVVFVGFFAFRAGPGGGLSAVTTAFAATALGGAIGVLLALALWTAVCHVLLLAGGAPAHGIGRTFQAICYSNGANIVSAVPCVGIYIGWIWWLVSAVLMVKEGQKVSGARASFAVLSLPVLGLVSFVALYIWAISLAVSSSRMTMSAATMQVSTQAVTASIVTYAAANNGSGPAHASMLVSSGNLAGTNLVNIYQAGSETTVPVADTTLDQFELLPTNKRNMKAREAADALPANVIAHRLGDFVFTYHGIDLSRPTAGLWVVIWSPDPGANAVTAPDVLAAGGASAGEVPARAVGGPGQVLVIGLADGTALTIPPPFSAALRAQNALRATHQLSPLPDPATVTHDAPAVSDVDP